VGRVVRFVKKFYLPCPPSSATLHITADNGYQVSVNGNFVGSAQVAPVPGWETSNLKKASLNTDGWNTVENYPVNPTFFNIGANTLEVLAGNEYFNTDDGDPSAGTASNNPGGVIFELAIEYEDCGSCCMQIEMPDDLAGAPGAKVEISGYGTFTNGQTAIMPSGKTVKWRLWVNNKCSQWYDKDVDCQPLVIDSGKYCPMEIQMSPDLAGAPGAKVEISGVGTYKDDDTVILPVCVTVKWRLWVNNKCSQWYDKHVSCDPLVVDPDKYCLMLIDLPDDLASQPGAKVEISGVGTYNDGAKVALPVCVTIQWRLWTNNKCGPWGYKHVDCTPLTAENICITSYCPMEVKIPADLASQPGAKVEISGVGTFTNGAKVILPVSLSIQWRLWVNNKCSEWYDKHVDCSALVVDPAKYCLMDIQMPDELAGAPGAKVEISGVGTYGNDAIVALPVCVTVQWRLWVNNKCSQWYDKHVDCSALAVDSKKYCLMDIQIPADTKAEISGVGTYSNGAIVVLPVCVTVQWRLWVNNKCGQWYDKHVDCNPLVGGAE
jgi:hypothetical protein